MAVKKSASKPKAKDASAPKKKASVQTAAKKETATRKATPAAKKTAAAPKKGAGAAAGAAAKKPAAKKAAPPKLSPSQNDLLARVGSAGEPGYLSEKKAELRSLEALQAKKLIKRGTKDKASGNYRYSVSAAGKKHLSAAPAAAPAEPSAPAPQAPGNP